jgi:hypothetical protein
MAKKHIMPDKREKCNKVIIIGVPGNVNDKNHQDKEINKNDG